MQLLYARRCDIGCDWHDFCCRQQAHAESRQERHDGTAGVDPRCVYYSLPRSVDFPSLDSRLRMCHCRSGDVEGETASGCDPASET